LDDFPFAVTLLRGFEMTNQEVLPLCRYYCPTSPSIHLNIGFAYLGAPFLQESELHNGSFLSQTAG
jgi:hypothetical protein